ncbi:MAG: hypothetical protein A3H06_02045 [Candidatus Colwellbacteria bacterium RIFCSPLOWO2_12_FULL_44_13]|uniref:AAA+ ATPase domain-containing protein n=3 Tax=Candidatus Colwelliibacteriota TaxID=1817904 RepID=A0A1G1Z813_9BACT|nr:MAG: hypothetical protein A3F24_02155 [Candidatus Colwellbacteria bacterium RIFCSPHIGHO2_12_FULL_44_17]OGY60654.1 MAG: hypothetical protein A3I31_02865 [Candidatus Colwellbacteria bacterium RIFCSPLOWO2_02_FULL_44_20b]OGY61495.1 MAG: hypothetical protein A3H06_02045 [Candidatus Colwellbacteria bacterium RIFCSPLOWO2_12_FULL_44_13]
MNLAKIFSAELEGIDARLIEVEVDINVGLHSFTIVGLGDKAVAEAKERVNAALKNSGVKPPNRENRKITVNLAPADVQKTGSQYDLAIAIGYLLATGQIKKFDATKKLFVGELSLDGTIRPVGGALNIAHLARELGFDAVFLPQANAHEASLVSGITLIPTSTLQGLIGHLEDRDILPVFTKPASPEARILPALDISEIKGQESAKRALMIAASGGHNVFMIGPPGSGKTMLAQSLVSILPQPDLEEVIEISKIYSAAGLFTKSFSYFASRPFRTPHHTASPVAVIGGGSNPRPGEISLSHRGVLFLDELPEFRRDVLEALRQPLESGTITVSRARGTLTFPARFTLVAAMNPCPCGFFNDPEKECTCTAYEVFKYQKKVSGPLLDRIDIQITVPRIKVEVLRGTRETEEGDRLREQVLTARMRQTERFAHAGKSIRTNSEMSSKQCDEFVNLSSGAETFLRERFDKLHLSPRAYYRILKTARTIADLENAPYVDVPHLAEAFQYRVKEIAS